MAATELMLSEPTGTKRISLDPQGTTVGRSSNCDLILDHDGVSRLHARIYQDPFGRWIVEDLKSRNGVFVEGQRVQAHAISRGQKVNISHFALSLIETPGWGFR